MIGISSVDPSLTCFASDCLAGVMTELMHLMDAVANQGRGSDGRKWQHPSDLSCRYADTVGGKGQIVWCVGGNRKQQNHSKQLIIIYIL